MRNQGQLIAGAVIILIGLVILAGNVLNVNLWGLCWPLFLILLGVWILFRPQLSGGDKGFSLVPIGDVVRDGRWPVEDEEIWAFVADIDLDLALAEIPVGETHYRVIAFVSDVEVGVPAGVGVAVHATAFVSSVKPAGEDEHESFLIPTHYTSPDYEAAERRVRLDLICFVGEVKIRHRPAA